MQTTTQTWRDLLAAGAPLQARATIGGVAYTDLSAPVINRALMQDRLSVGNVVSASLALVVRGAASIPRSASVVVEVRLSDGQTASEWLPQGKFYISRRMRDPVTGLLALECYDALLKANAVWTPSAGTWPRTMAAVVAELAALLGVTLDSRTVIPSGSVYVMAEPAEGTTIRDALSVVAQAAGGNWIMTPGNRLRLVRVGESGGTVDVTGVVGGIDVGQAGTVTGVRSTVDGVVSLVGDDTGIVVDVTVAPMIAADMAEVLIGQAYTPFQLSGAIYDPAAELGDGVRAGAGGEVVSALCSEQAAYGPAFRGDIAAPDPGEVTDEYPYIGSAERTLALAKAAVTEAVDRLDDELTQQEIFKRLTDNGAAQGLVLYNGQLYINASYINAGYLNANRIHGGELTLGGDGNINGWLNVLKEDNTAGVTINSAGIEINNNNNTLTSNGYWYHSTYLTPYYPRNYDGRVLVSAYDESDTERRRAYFAPIEIGLERTVNNVSYNSAAFSLNGINIQKIDRQPDQSMQATRVFLVDLYNHELRFTGDATINGALSVGDAATTRANLGVVGTSDVINVAHGGTGATDAALHITNDYSSVLNVINAVRNTRIFPISVQKSGTALYSDMPTTNQTEEWNLLLVGNSTRITATLYLFALGSGKHIYVRDFYNGSWFDNQWMQIH